MDLITEAFHRSVPLTIFGSLAFIGALICALMVYISDNQILGINAWIKPLKFFLSTVIFVWSMAWYLGYLEKTNFIITFEWVVIITLSFELFWITFKAAQGELSHFNVSNSFNGLMFSLMGIAISFMTIYTALIGFQFFTQTITDISESYLWGIRLGIIIFVIFAFEGGIMGAQLSHTVGAPDGSPGLKFFNWSVTNGDLRIAHFTGMHGLQVLPLIGYYTSNSKEIVLVAGASYLMLSMLILFQALRGKPLLNMN
jgi:hypothetical protein